MMIHDVYSQPHVRFSDVLQSQSFHSLLDNTRRVSTRLCLGDLILRCVTLRINNGKKNMPGKV